MYSFAYRSELGPQLALDHTVIKYHISVVNVREEMCKVVLILVYSYIAIYFNMYIYIYFDIELNSLCIFLTILKRYHRTHVSQSYQSY